MPRILFLFVNAVLRFCLVLSVACLPAGLGAATAQAAQPAPAAVQVQAQAQAQADKVLMVASVRDMTRHLYSNQPSVGNTVAYVQRELGYPFEVRRYPWNRLLQNLNNGEGLAFGLSKNQERLQTLHFSEPVYANYIWLVTRSDAVFPFAGVRDLRGKSLGVTRGTSYGDEFDRQKNLAFEIEEDSYALESRLNKLVNRRMDALLFQHRNPHPEQVEAMLNRRVAEEMPEVKLPPGVSFKVLPKPLLIDPIHFAIRADLDDGIIARINGVISKGKKNGDLTRALDQGS
jgi:ABC-type amino acid transport substrate-binding protein